jgi:hypothetical protein
MTTPAFVRLDDDDGALPAYRHLKLPEDWFDDIGPRLPLSDIYNAILGRVLPPRDWYGFIADDLVPETIGWDRALIETARRDGMAVPGGSDTTGPCPHFVLGGDLVREIGWLALPGLSRLYIDTVWRDIALARGVYRERRDVVLRHRHFSNGLALYDETYRKPDKAHDRAIYERWKGTPT